MQGVEGQIFGPMARTYAYALIGALIATFTVTPCLASLLMAEQITEVETARRAPGAFGLHAGAALVARQPAHHGRHRAGLSAVQRIARHPARQRISAHARRGQSVDSRVDAADDFTGGRRADRQQNSRNPVALSRGHDCDLAAGTPGRRQRRRRLLQCRVLRAAQAGRSMAAKRHQGIADCRSPGRIQQGIRRHRLQLLAIYPGQCRRGPVRRQRRQLGKDRRSRSENPRADRARMHGANGAGPGHYRSRGVLGARPA